MIYCPQYTPFLEEEGYDCTEPEPYETLVEGENPFAFWNAGMTGVSFSFFALIALISVIQQ
jgi:hypothetical protein